MMAQWNELRETCAGAASTRAGVASGCSRGYTATVTDAYILKIPGNPRRRALAIGIAMLFSLCEAAHATTIVVSCTDNGPGDIGNLRNSLANAPEGGTVDLTSLSCSEISLHMGQLAVLQSDLTIKGPGADALAITGIYNGTRQLSRILQHQGTGILTIKDLSVRDGYLQAAGQNARGGCITSAGSIVLDHASVTHCTAASTGVGAGVQANGGGIYVAGNLTLQHSVVSANLAGPGIEPSFGGGANVIGSLKMYYSTVSDNRAGTTGPYGLSGGISASGAVLVSSSTISGNKATYRSGGLSAGGESVTISNSTISGNVAESSFGGGLSLFNVLHVHINNSTVAFNKAGSASGQFYLYAPGVAISSAAAHSQYVTVQSSLFANNSFGAGTQYDLSIKTGAVLSGSNNLVHITGSDVPPDTKVGAQGLALLGPLRDNGGPTLTHALASNSPAIDAGNNLEMPSLPNDQRGPQYSRVLGGTADIGAYEYDATEVVFFTGFEGG